MGYLDDIRKGLDRIAPTDRGTLEDAAVRGSGGGYLESIYEGLSAIKPIALPDKLSVPSVPSISPTRFSDTDEAASRVRGGAAAALANKAKLLPEYSPTADNTGFVKAGSVGALRIADRREGLSVGAAMGKAKQSALAAPSLFEKEALKGYEPVITQDELAVFNALKKSGNTADANRYLDAIMPDVQKREQENWQRFAQEQQEKADAYELAVAQYMGKASALPNYQENLDSSNPYGYLTSDAIRRLGTGEADARANLSVGATIGKPIEREQKPVTAAFPNAKPLITKEELATYNTLKGAGRVQDAQDFLKNLTHVAWKRERINLLEEVEKNNNFDDFLMYAIGGQTGAAAFIGTALTPDTELDINDPMFHMLAVREAAAERIIMGSKYDWLAELGLAMTDMAASMWMGPTQPAILAGFASLSSGQTVYDVLSRGGTRKAALVEGGLNAAVEVLTEKIELGVLWRTLKPATNAALLGGESIAKRIFKDLGLNIATQASQEWLAEVIEGAIDRKVMGEQSDFEIYKRYMMQQGYSDADAEHMALREFFIVQPLQAAFIGALMGVTLGGGAATVGGIRSHVKKTQLRNELGLVLEKQGITDKAEQTKIIDAVAAGNVNALHDGVVAFARSKVSEGTNVLGEGQSMHETSQLAGEKTLEAKPVPTATVGWEGLLEKHKDLLTDANKKNIEREMRRFYEAGYRGVAQDSVSPMRYSVDGKPLISMAVADEAWAAGLAEGIGKMEAPQAVDGVSYGEKGGLIKSPLMEALRKNGIVGVEVEQFLDALAKHLGVKIDVVAADTLKNAAGDIADAEIRNGIIFLDESVFELQADGQQIVIAKTIHETVHKVRAANPEAYAKVRDFVVSSIMQSGDTALFTENMRSLAELYNKGGEVSLDDVVEEFMAEFIANLPNMKPTIEQAVKKDPKGVKRFLAWLRKVINKLRGIKNLPEIKGTSYEDAFGLKEQQLREVERLFADALKGADGQAATKAGKVKAAESKQSLRKQSAETKTIKQLAAENRRLAQKLEEAKAELKTTEGKPTRLIDVRRYAGQILDDHGSMMSKERLTQELKAVYDDIANIDETQLSSQEIMSRLKDIAYEVVANAQVLNNEDSETYARLTNYLKANTLKVTNDLKRDYGAAEFKLFRERNKNRIRMRNNEGLALDVYMNDLASEFPDLFYQDDMVDIDRLNALEHMLDEMKPYFENPYSHDIDRAAAWLAADLFEAHFEMRQAKPTAMDKMQAKLDKARADVAKAKQAVKDAKAEAKAKADDKVAKGKLLKAEDDFRIASNQLAELMYAGRIEARHTGKVAQSLIREIKRRETMMDKLREKYSAKEQKAKERQKSAILRKKIDRVIKQLRGKLEKSTKTKHIKPAMQRAVGQLLDSIDWGVASKAAGESVAVLKTEVGEAVKSEADPTVYELLNDKLGVLYDAVKETPYKEMNSTNLRDLYEIIKAIDFAVRLEDKLFSENIAARINDLNLKSQAELATDKTRSWVYEHTFAGSLGDMFSWQTLTPYFAFERLGDTWLSVYNEARSGLDTYIKRIMQTRIYASSLVRGMDLQKFGWYSGQAAGVRAKRMERTLNLDNGVIRMTDAEMMTVYMLSKRKAAKKHLLEEGIKLGRTKAEIALTENDIDTITEKLGHEKRRIADALGKYLTNTTAAWGNETSLKVHGIKLFNEENYWAIYVDKTAFDFSVEAAGQADKRTLLNSPHTKPTTNSGKRVIVGSVFEDFMKQVDFMANYSGFAAPATDMQRLYNAKGMKEAIARKFGNAANRYVEQFLIDLNKGARPDIDMKVFSSLLGWSKQALVTANVSVGVQQGASLFRVLGAFENPAKAHKYLLASLPNMANRGQWSLVKKYAPIAQLKTLGYIENFMSPSFRKVIYREGFGDKFFNLPRHGKFQDLTTMLIQENDKSTWLIIWNMCEMEVAETTSLEKGTDAFYREVGKRFSVAIDKTQVVDSVFHRSQLMRSKNFGAKLVTAFLYEPTLTYNNMVAASRQFINSNKANRSVAARRFMLAYWGSILSIVADAAAKLAMRAWRGSWDDDKTLLEQLFHETIRQSLGGLPLFNDLVDMAYGWDADRLDMNGFAKLIRSMGDLGKLLKGESSKTAFSVVLNSIGNLAAVFGVPIPNITREAYDAMRHLSAATDNLHDDLALLQVFYNPAHNQSRHKYIDVLWENQSSPDAAWYRNELNKLGITDEQIEKRFTALKKKEKAFKADSEKAGSAAEDSLRKNKGFGSLDEDEQAAALALASSFAAALVYQKTYGGDLTGANASTYNISKAAKMSPEKVMLFKVFVKRYKGYDKGGSDTSLSKAEIKAAANAADFLSNTERRWIEKNWK